MHWYFYAYKGSIIQNCACPHALEIQNFVQPIVTIPTKCHNEQNNRTQKSVKNYFPDLHHCLSFLA